MNNNEKKMYTFDIVINLADFINEGGKFENFETNLVKLYWMKDKKCREFEDEAIKIASLKDINYGMMGFWVDTEEQYDVTDEDSRRKFYNKFMELLKDVSFFKNDLEMVQDQIDIILNHEEYLEELEEE